MHRAKATCPKWGQPGILDLILRVSFTCATSTRAIFFWHTVGPLKSSMAREFIMSHFSLFTLRAKTGCLLQFQLTQEPFLCRTDFSADAILFDVLHYIDEHRSDGHGPYLLRTPYPHRYLNTNNGSQTLTDLDLCPRSLLALQPVNAAPSTTSITGIAPLAICPEFSKSMSQRAVESRF